MSDVLDWTSLSETLLRAILLVLLSLRMMELLPGLHAAGSFPFLGDTSLLFNDQRTVVAKRDFM